MPVTEKPRLTRAYLLDHVEAQPSGEDQLLKPADNGESATFSREFRNHVLNLAAKQLGDNEADEMTVNVPVRLFAVEQVLKGCVGINIGVIEAHWDFQGQRPGKG